MHRALIFLLIVIVIGGLLEWYTYRGLRSKWNNYSRWFRVSLKSVFFLFLSLSVLSVLMAATVGSYFPRYVTNFFFGFVMINFFVKLVLAFFLLTDDLRRVGIFAKRKVIRKPVSVRQTDVEAGSEKITRSDFLVRAGVIAAA